MAKGVADYFKEDFVKYVRENKIKIWGTDGDIWFYTAHQVLTKCQKKLNRELNIHAINKKK